MFPLSIKFKKKLLLNDSQAIENFFKKIQRELVRQKADEIKSDNGVINFRNWLFLGQHYGWHLMAMVDSGSFFYSNSTNDFIYTISTKRSFFIILAMSILFFLISQSIFIAVMVFIWLYGMNISLAVIRHRNFFNKIIRLKNLTSISK